MKNIQIQLPVHDDVCLAAMQNGGSICPEIRVGLTKNGVWMQDIVIVALNCEIICDENGHLTRSPEDGDRTYIIDVEAKTTPDITVQDPESGMFLVTAYAEEGYPGADT